MRLPFLTARLRTDRPVQGVPALLRGFFGRRQPANVLLHQHLGEGADARLVYLYPRVQYRFHQGTAQIIGIGEGVTAVLHTTEGLDLLDLAGWQYRVLGVDYEEGEVELEERSAPCGYTFLSPWLALNQMNHARYQAASSKEREQLLQRILIGNVLSLCQSFGLRVIQRLEVAVDLRPTTVYYKKQRLVGFLGRFSINFQLAHCLGLGHLVSIGFGEVTDTPGGRNESRPFRRDVPEGSSDGSAHHRPGR